MPDDQEPADTESRPYDLSEQQQIAVLAYYYWQERGSPHGSPDEDWFRAAQDIRARREQAAAKRTQAA